MYIYMYIYMYMCVSIYTYPLALQNGKGKSCIDDIPIYNSPLIPNLPAMFDYRTVSICNIYIYIRSVHILV